MIHVTSTVAAPAGFASILADPRYVDVRDLLVDLEAPSYPQSVGYDRKIFSTSIKTVSTTVQGASHLKDNGLYCICDRSFQLSLMYTKSERDKQENITTQFLPCIQVFESF
jgi:hypothetical protein